MREFNKDKNSSCKWIEAPPKLKLGVPFLKAIPLRPLDNDTVEYQAETDRGPMKLETVNSCSFAMSNGDCYDDMCDMDILNEPEVLYNLVQRYKQEKIFTFIGPTLIIINPYRILPQYFGQEVMLRIRDKIIQGTSHEQKPHIYLIAGNAYTSMIDQGKKQAIVISGESGAGKTESTKYCMQLLTSLSHKESHPIETKILACNPLLEAFGNSKTIRNDNSSRFGKYVQIYFGEDNMITGANIHSYLLEKSRVVAVAENQRSFHIFYALIASGEFDLEKPSQYKYLARSKNYEAVGIDDKKYFEEIKKSMKSIGFTEKEQNRIWELLTSILSLGNIEFDDSNHKNDENKPCEVKNKKNLEKIALKLGISEGELEKILLFEKKKFLKQFTLSPYNANKCYANVNTLSKAIYNSIFEFVLFKIQKSLRPTVNKNYNSINILDIFGFQNFENNSFEQFCINFTNEKLLKLYNQYVFEREMKILKEDGLEKQIMSIVPPTNDEIIETISGKLSLFSIINDLTTPQQFKDSDIIQGFQSKLSKSVHLQFDKINKTKFIVIHSQCSVTYDIDGFKDKNQDKVLPEISDITNKLFEHESKEQVGKTLLTKFSTEISDLMNELNSSSVHFIRCIKPNEKKIANCAEQIYLMTQIRYLGVCETIQIRKKTFPSRWVYKEFLQRFGPLFPTIIGNDRTKTEKIMKQLAKGPHDFLLGNSRVYMNSEIQSILSRKLHEMMKVKMMKGKIIWKAYKKYKFRKNVLKNLKTLVKRIRAWKKIAAQAAFKLQKKGFEDIRQFSERKKEQQKLLKNKKLMEAKLKREEEQKMVKKMNEAKKKAELPKVAEGLALCIKKIIYRRFLEQAEKMKKSNVVTTKPVQNKPELKIKVKVNQNLNESLLNESIVEQTKQVYQREIKEEEAQQKQFEFNRSFLDQKSIQITNRPDVLFEGTLQIPLFNPDKATGLPKLKLILAEQYKFQFDESDQDFFSPPSDDGNFKIEDTPEEIMKKIIAFDAKNFFKKVLRKRTNFIGMSKDEDDILIAKPRPLSKSLTLLNESDEQDAIKVFKYLIKISEEAKLENVFKLIETMITLCHGTSPELKNEVLLQLIKQSNTDSELPSVRILQTLSVFLHIYSPDNDFINASLNFFFKKLADDHYSEKQNEYVRYVFKKMVRKMERPVSINYMPIKYQLMALMCKRMISIPVYLPVGNSVLIRVESYETFSDIKARVLEELGINSKRILPEYFTFFEIINFDNQELEESPVVESQIVWDTITYWEKAKDKYKEKGVVNPPGFFLMLKIRYVYECNYSDEESVELMFHQTYFDYFVGRIRLGLQEMGALAACIKCIKFDNQEGVKLTYPTWTLKKYEDSVLEKAMMENVRQMKKEKFDTLDMKFRFLTVASISPLCLTLALGTDQNVKLFMKSKELLLAQKYEIIERIPIKKITKYAEDEQKFVFSIRGETQTKIIYTEHASICSSYLGMLPYLVKRASSHSENILNF